MVMLFGKMLKHSSIYWYLSMSLKSKRPSFWIRSQMIQSRRVKDISAMKPFGPSDEWLTL